MQKANAIGGILSILTGAVWVLVSMASWPAAVGVVVSMLLGAYWAFGRQLVAGQDMPTRDRDRGRDRG